ncbi:MAG: low molecular weight phosphotyrosine protein phosphatase [Bacteroidetes bacterium]|nr:low molecular weight phosphotyrosine protein phosphatase [Bacteroidota bacterium]
MKVLMVCLGNICRSPLAQGILEHKVKGAGLDWQVDSAGTGAWHVGQQPDRRSCEVAHKYGIDITAQAARRISHSDLQDFDLVYCMDSSNYNDVMRICKTEEEESKVKLIMNEAEPKQNINVPDPYFGGGDGFELVYQMLDRACDSIIDKRR